ncbi:hypothetical protein GL50803_0011174 [Giardia duodenalis]|uniref:Uncharacterized protein n=1 Tax=Giardia intestinalis (strain ATCC 50803 / WB clone C6) TaxID=184922 RepID=D3KGJ6_GIAIC|nr:hypothetical protein GL50803_0011174 [Giardia intestinalis]KAE8305348.1 hypothetical protein GL50803_0011174 [Giardia intestinalis]
MPARRASPRPRTRQLQAEAQAPQATPEGAGPRSSLPSKRTRPHTTRPRCTKIVASRDFEAVPGPAGHPRYEYTTNIKFLPPSYFQYKYRSATRQGSATPSVHHLAEHSPPASPRRSAKSTKQQRTKAVNVEPKLSLRQDKDDQNELELRQKCTGAQFSDNLVPALIPADTTSPQEILHDNSPYRSLDPVVPQGSPSSTTSKGMRLRADCGLLQSSNMIFEPCPSNPVNCKQGPLLSSLLAKGTLDNLQSLSLTAVENPSLATLARRQARHARVAWDEEPERDDEKNPSPFSSIVQFPPPVIQPTIPAARRARSAETLTVSQDVDDSLLDFMFVDL